MKKTRELEMAVIEDSAYRINTLLSIVYDVQKSLQNIDKNYCIEDVLYTNEYAQRDLEVFCDFTQTTLYDIEKNCDRYKK